MGEGTETVDPKTQTGAKPRPTVLLDRDGTLLSDPGYLGDPGDVRFLAGAVNAMRELVKAGYRLIVVTNQSGIGRGYISEEQVLAVNLEVTRMLFREGVRLDGIYYCPHHPDDGCLCRKPETMMVERARTDFRLEPSASWVVGDVERDIQLGINSGLKTILVETGHTEKGDIPAGTVTAPDLKAAAGIILGEGV